jgi:hypothetical protein
MGGLIFKNQKSNKSKTIEWSCERSKKKLSNIGKTPKQEHNAENFRKSQSKPFSEKEENRLS